MKEPTLIERLEHLRQHFVDTDDRYNEELIFNAIAALKEKDKQLKYHDGADDCWVECEEYGTNF